MNTYIFSRPKGKQNGNKFILRHLSLIQTYYISIPKVCRCVCASICLYKCNVYPRASILYQCVSHKGMMNVMLFASILNCECEGFLFIILFVWDDGGHGIFIKWESLDRGILNASHPPYRIVYKILPLVRFKSD